jgi:hypothetical protein
VITTIRKSIHFLSLILCLILVSVSCKKTDQVVFEETGNRQKFFEGSSNLDNATQQAFVASLMRSDDLNDFTDKLGHLKGQILWNKMQYRIRSGSDMQVTGGEAASETERADSLVIIPMIRDSETLEGIIIARKRPGDSAFSVFSYNHDYLYFYTRDNEINRQLQVGLLSIFLHMEKSVFEDQEFHSIPSGVFDSDFNNPSEDRRVSVRESEFSISENRMRITVCYTIINCGTPYLPVCQGPDGCDKCPEYCNPKTVCVSEYFDGAGDEGPIGPGVYLGGGSSGWGSGSGTGGSYGGSAPSVCRGVWYKTMPCGTGTGGTGGGAYPSNSAQLNFILENVDLETDQINWLRSPEATGAVTAIYNGLLRSSNQDPSDQGDINLGPTDAAIAATKVLITSAMNGLVDGPYDANHYNLIKQYLPFGNSQASTDPMFWYRFTVSCVMIKIDNPTWSNWDVFWAASEEMILMTLDLAGMFPIVGEIADFTSMTIYAFKGDGVNAAISAASMIPFAGWFPAGIRLAKYTYKLADGATTSIKWIVRNDGLIDFGSRGQFRKIVGLAKGDPRHAHHIVPLAHVNHDLVQKAAQAKNPFHVHHKYNGMPITTTQHDNGHLIYNDNFKRELDLLWNSNPNMDAETAQKLLDGLITRAFTAINNNPGISLNNLSF